MIYSSLAIATVAVGIADGALADITTLATAKVPMFADGTLASNPLFRHRLAEADTQLRAAGRCSMPTSRHMGDRDGGRGVHAGAAGADPKHGGMGDSAAAQVVDAAYTAGGGTALYSNSPLQRRLRDVHAVTQHFVVKPDTLTLAGAVFAGQDVDLTFL